MQPALELRGRIDPHVSMAKLTWLCVGGPADGVFHPQDSADLSVFLKGYGDQPIFIMGAGSNVLVRDGGIRGIVVRLGRGFRQWTVLPGAEIDIGAGVPDRQVAQMAAQAGISGFEFLYTIPGLVGGGLAMNAGCYGGEFADRLVWAQVMDTEGQIHQIGVNDLGYGYRTCKLPQGWIFLGGRFRGTPGDRNKIEATMAEFGARREHTQPTHVKTGGSTFANPPGQKAWQLIDAAGFRDRVRGGAQFSPKHCNFLVNLGHASADDLEKLAEEARHAVLAQTGHPLKWEIVRWGQSAPASQ
jgi:UDP-N-acetylmuramate dehydrogenase